MYIYVYIYPLPYIDTQSPGPRGSFMGQSPILAEILMDSSKKGDKFPAFFGQVHLPGEVHMLVFLFVVYFLIKMAGLKKLLSLSRKIVEKF